MFKCYHCGNDTVTWNKDFTFDDFSREGEGIVQVYHCSTCGADIHCHVCVREEENNERTAG